MTNLPEWFSDDLVRKIKAGISREFILYGDLYGLFANPDEEEKAEKPYLDLQEFLEWALSQKEITVFYNIASGFTFPYPAMEIAFKKIVGMDEDDIQKYQRDPGVCLMLLEKLLKTTANVAVVITSLQTLAPNSAGAATIQTERANIERIKLWAKDRDIKENGNLIIMTTDQLMQIHEELRKSGIGIESIMIEPPTEEERQAFIELMTQGEKKQFEAADDFDVKVAAIASQGLNLSQIKNVFRYCQMNQIPITRDEINNRKIEILRAAYGDVAEIVDPSIPLDDVGGLDEIKDDQRYFLEALREGRIEEVPKGVFLCGPPGTGKTLLAEAVAYEAGVLCFIAKSIRDKFLGVSEARQERYHYLLRANAPCIDVNDEIDLSSSKRGSDSGDHGVSARLMQMKMTFLSDSKIRGKILSYFMSNRPDNVDAAMKRSGRMDERYVVPMPTVEARSQIFAIMFRKYNKLATDIQDFLPLAESIGEVSGADIEAICLRANRRVKRAKGKIITQADMQFAIDDFIPSASQKEIDHMTLIAILESSSRERLPENVDEMVAAIIERGLVDDLAEYAQTFADRRIAKIDPEWLKNLKVVDFSNMFAPTVAPLSDLDATVALEKLDRDDEKSPPSEEPAEEGGDDDKK
ncbi:ATP-binding protein [Candidatus Kuenenbacteria bacterium]|nr:ATP-binding protein [Candidatus Kuenenbacteria bacterium]